MGKNDSRHGGVELTPTPSYFSMLITNKTPSLMNPFNAKCLLLDRKRKVHHDAIYNLDNVTFNPSAN